MKLRPAILVLTLVCMLPSAVFGGGGRYSKMFVKRHGDDLWISAKMDSGRDITYWFKPCMFNQLYSFYRVGMSASNYFEPTTLPANEPDVILNVAYSDNIGPFAIEGHGWCGGNHKYMERTARTAFNEKYSIEVNGRTMEGDWELWAGGITIRVENIILDPSRPYIGDDGMEELRDTLCRESVTYRIYSNSIDVRVSHKFHNPVPLTIATYYGMQSMFEGETHTFTSAGAYTDWTPQERVSSFTKGDFPHFRRFVEKNTAAYQSSFLLPHGSGGHDELGEEDVVFIGNSHGKSYHKLISGKIVRRGDELVWQGIYTWFAEPLADDGELLCYEGTVEGCPALFIDSKKACERSLALPSHLKGGYDIFDSAGELNVSVLDGRLNVSAGGAAGCVLVFRD